MERMEVRLKKRQSLSPAHPEPFMERMEGKLPWLARTARPAMIHGTHGGEALFFDPDHGHAVDLQRGKFTREMPLQTRWPNSKRIGGVRSSSASGGPMRANLLPKRPRGSGSGLPAQKLEITPQRLPLGGGGSGGGTPKARSLCSQGKPNEVPLPWPSSRSLGRHLGKPNGGSGHAGRRHPGDHHGGHLLCASSWRRGWDSNPRTPKGSLGFEPSPFDRSGTSPNLLSIIINGEVSSRRHQNVVG